MILNPISCPKVTPKVAKNVTVNGHVTGDIRGSEKVVISKTGRVKGNITAPRVTLEDGAKFKGSIDMDPGESIRPAAKIAPTAAALSPEVKQDASYRGFPASPIHAGKTSERNKYTATDSKPFAAAAILRY